MKSGTIVAIIVVLLLVAGGAYLAMRHPGGGTSGPTATTTAQTGQANPQMLTTVTPAGLSFSYSEPYGLATNPEQILVKSYIPSCMSPFDYCIYRTGNAYANTNFESAGIAIRERTDLKTQTSCLTEPPMGYAGQHATTTQENGYATSVSAPLGNGATGHYSNGYQYRLWYGTTCYEFNLQIGESQFANYPAGTKTEFTAADRATVMGELKDILANMQANGMRIVFPQT